jgi:hypothetical protein
MPFGAIGECFPVRAFRGKHAQKNLTLVASEIIDRDRQVSGKRLRMTKAKERRGGGRSLQKNFHENRPL